MAIWVIWIFVPTKKTLNIILAILQTFNFLFLIISNQLVHASQIIHGDVMGLITRWVMMISAGFLSSVYVYLILKSVDKIGPMIIKDWSPQDAT
jgi:hypothetical protein